MIAWANFYDPDRSARDSFGSLAPKVFHTVENYFPRHGKNGLIFAAPFAEPLSLAAEAAP